MLGCMQVLNYIKPGCLSSTVERAVFAAGPRDFQRRRSDTSVEVYHMRHRLVCQMTSLGPRITVHNEIQHKYRNLRPSLY